jgi:hypothetical protein
MTKQVKDERLTKTDQLETKYLWPTLEHFLDIRLDGLRNHNIFFQSIERTHCLDCGFMCYNAVISCG